MPIFGMLRIRNEARWIKRVIRSIQPICEKIFVLDDHSTDGTPEICEDLGVNLFRSTFSGLDESRDKTMLLKAMYEIIPWEYKAANVASPYWALAIDGDEELADGHGEMIKNLVITQNGPHVYSLRVAYLWDAEDRIRVDGVYGKFFRPSLFRLFNETFKYQKTPWGNGANFHCSNIPQELLYLSAKCDATLLHYGYLHKEDRLKKFAWYNRVDPNNAGEDFYKHMVQGDLPEFPADAKFKWAGPLRVVSMERA